MELYYSIGDGWEYLMILYALIWTHNDIYL